MAAHADLDATEVAPAVVRRGDRTTLLVGELHNPGTERVSLLASHLPHARVTERILGCLWTALAQDAVLAAASVTGQPLAEVLAAPRNQPLLLAIAREVLTRVPAMPESGPPQPMLPEPVGGFDPADLPGSLARLAQARRISPNAHTEAYLDLAVRHRPSEVPAVLGRRGGALVQRVVDLVQAIEQGRRACSPGNVALLAAHERLERLGRAAQRGVRGDRRPGPGPQGPRRAAGGAPGRRQGHHRGGRRADPLRQPGQRPPPGRRGRGPGRPSAGGRRRGVRHHPVPGVRGRVRAS